MRAVAISVCVAGLHNTLGLEPDHARAYWLAAICKGVTAKLLADTNQPGQPEELFTMGLLQDLGVAVFAASAGEEYAQMLRDPEVGISQQLEYEHACFGFDHAECGYRLAQKIALPDCHALAIREHHRQRDLSGEAAAGSEARALFAASCVAHDIRSVQRDGLERLAACLRADDSLAFGENLPAFLEQVKVECERMMTILNGGEADKATFAELVQQASIEILRMTTKLVGQNHSLSETHRDLYQTMDQLEDRATHDPLTRLLNRDGFLKKGADALARARPTQHPLGLALFDLDRFKVVNDVHGHAAGDAVLQAVAQRLLAAVRSNEIVCRWGGDEIVVLFEHVKQEDCRKAAARILQAVERDPVTWKDQQIPVSVSVGVYWVPEVDEQMQIADLVAEVDPALYKAKCAGRGRMVMSGLETSGEVPSPTDGAKPLSGVTEA